MCLFKSTKDTKTDKASNGLSNRSAIGVDISQHAIRMVQLTGRSLNQIQLKKYVITKLPKNIAKGNKVQDYSQLTTYIQHTYAQLRSSYKDIVAAVPQNLATVEQIIYNSHGTDLDSEEFVEAGIGQFTPIEEMNYDFQAGEVGSGQHVLAVVTKKDDVEPRIEMSENVGLPLPVLDLGLLAQRNVFVYWVNTHAPEMADEKATAFGIHAAQMYVLILQSGRILYKQETPVNTEQLNQLIQRTYQVTEEEAARMMAFQNKSSDYQSQITGRFNVQVAQEVWRVLQLHYTTQVTDSFSSIRHILLTGFTAQQVDLAESISSQTNTTTEYLHPISYVERSAKVELPRLQIDAPSLALAFRLTLRGL